MFGQDEQGQAVHEARSSGRDVLLATRARSQGNRVAERELTYPNLSHLSGLTLREVHTPEFSIVATKRKLDCLTFREGATVFSGPLAIQF